MTRLTPKRYFLLTTAMATFVSFVSLTAHADDFEHSGVSSDTNAGFILDGFDSLTITEDGEIATVGDLNNAVESSGGVNVITNDGSVSTTGNDARGIAAGALDIVNNNGTVSTQGESAFGIEALDVGLITNSGSITTAGNGAIGISVFDGNTVTNTGSIETLNVNATGIRIFSDNTVVNSGSISTALSFSEGIDADSDNVIENSGEISTLGNNSRGIEAGETNQILTSGMILTSGNNSEGVFAESFNQIENTGDIRTTGDNSEGIRVFNSNLIDNRTDITTSGLESHGIRGQSGNTIINRGNIFVTGVGANGIEVGNMNTIANVGRIVSVNGRSINFGTNGTLTLTAPAFIGGEIGLWTNTTVLIVTGKSHSVLWDLSTGIIEGGSPFFSGAIPVFYNDVTTQVATIDPSALAASANVLADMSSDVSGLIRYGLARSEPEVTLGFGEGSVVDRRWWISGFGSRNDYDGNTNILDQDFSHAGLAIGYQTDIAQDWSIGGMLGYSTGELQVDAPFTPSFDNDIDGVFGAVYGRKRLRQSFIDLSLSGAFLSHSDTRFVNDNLAPLGLAQAEGSYDSWWLAPEIRVGHDGELQDNWFLTPSAEVRYTYQSIDGYTEVGTANAFATVASRDVGVLETQLELAATKVLPKAVVTGRLGWRYRDASGDSSVQASLVGQNQLIPYSSNTGNDYYIAADARIALAENISMDISARAISGETEGYGGALRFIWDF